MTKRQVGVTSDQPFIQVHALAEGTPRLVLANPHRSHSFPFPKPCAVLSMASPWVRTFDEVDSDVPFIPPSTSASSRRSSFHENEKDYMLSPQGSEQRLAQAQASTFPSTMSSSSMDTGARPQYFHQHDAHTLVPSHRNPLASPSSSSAKSFPLSPLNPTSPPVHSPFARPGSSGSARIKRIASEESRALSLNSTSPLLKPGSRSSRGSMILYRRANDVHSLADESGLIPPTFSHGNRGSLLSSSGDSMVSLSSDSKYPSGMMFGERGLVAYAYDPALDEMEPANAEDLLHDPDEKIGLEGRRGGVQLSWRGITNFATLILLVLALLGLFVAYPVFVFYHDDGRNTRIVGNTRINSTGQAVDLAIDSRDQSIFL